MIFDKCENCKYYHPLATKSKSIFSKKPKLKKSYIGIDWCEKYERKNGNKGE